MEWNEGNFDIWPAVRGAKPAEARDWRAIAGGNHGLGAQFGKHVHFFSVPFCALFVLPLMVAA